MVNSTSPFALELQEPTRAVSPVDPDEPRKRWYHYLPLALAVFLLLSPHPSLLVILVHYHWQILHSRFLFFAHLLGAYALTFCAFCSLIVCVARDPGSPRLPSSSGALEDSTDADGELSLTEALMAPGSSASEDDEYSKPGRWCSRCWAPKPERAHHCSTCGRCVLKMDHHCVWLGNRCIGHRTYPAFVHFVTCITLMAIHLAWVAISTLVFAFSYPMSIDEATPIHALFLAAEGLVFALVIGSFLIYHLYLISTNQTTLEHISPFLLLRFLPPLPPSQDGVTSSKLSDPPREYELSYKQRRAVRRAHGAVRMYDVGWRSNWAEAVGRGPSGVMKNGKRRPAWHFWVHRIVFGGGSRGNGRTFPRNPDADEMLARLAAKLVEDDAD